MRKTHYFIENENQEWYYIREGLKTKELDPFGLDRTIYHYCDFTADPMQAIRYNTKEQAEYNLKNDWDLKKIKGLKITEHEFIINPIT